MIFPIVRLFSRRRSRLFLVSVGLFGLVGCNRSLDLKATETKLKEDLIKQGVASLKQVSCPELLPVGKEFACTGIFDSGIGFTIPIQHQEEGDKLKAEIPSIKGMLNMDQVLKTIREELKMGEGASIDCAVSSPYRMVTLSSTFECTLALQDEQPKDEKPKNRTVIPQSEGNKLPTPAVKEPDKIEIAIAASGDVTWQRLVAAAPGSIKPGAFKPGDKPDEKVGDKLGDKMPTEDTEKSSPTTPIAPEKNVTPPLASPGDVPYDS